MDLIEQLKRDEGCRRTASGNLVDYRDSKGLWTRGYGHLITPQPGPDFVPRELSPDEAHTLLLDDIAKHARELDRALPWLQTYPPVVRDAVLNMAFNLGIPRLLKFTGFLAALRRAPRRASSRQAACDYAMAAIEMLDSKWHREDVGARAVRLAKQVVTGEYQ